MSIFLKNFLKKIGLSLLFFFAMGSLMAHSLSNIQAITRKSMKVQRTIMLKGSENMANAESPGYVPQRVVVKTNFDRAMKSNLVDVKKIHKDSSKKKNVYQPFHPQADEKGYVSMPSINPLIELMDVQTAKHNYERGLEVHKMATDIRHKSISLIQQR